MNLLSPFALILFVLQTGSLLVPPSFRAFFSYSHAAAHVLKCGSTTSNRVQPHFDEARKSFSYHTSCEEREIIFLFVYGSYKTRCHLFLRRISAFLLGILSGPFALRFVMLSFPPFYVNYRNIEFFFRGAPESCKTFSRSLPESSTPLSRRGRPPRFPC